jgi:hypothetical protein
MLRRSTWILLLIFAALVGFTWLFQRYQADKAANSATATPTIPLSNLYALDNTQVNDIKIADSSGNQIEVYKDPLSDQWAITGVPVEEADSFKIESISGQLFALQAQETLTDTPPLESIGLVIPAYVITITTSQGAQLVTNVGSSTPIGSGYYCRVGTGQVVIVNKLVLDDILGLLTNPPLLPTPTPEVTATESVSPTDSGFQVTPTP